MTRNRGNPVSVDCYLSRRLDALGYFGDFTPLDQDLHLHHLSSGITLDPFARQLLVDGLSALGLYLASRPHDEHVGWTISLQKPRMNLFFVGSPEDGSIIGRAFTEEGDVLPRDENIFICQSKRAHGDGHESIVDVQGIDIFAMVESYERRSEQKPSRYFSKGSRIALVQALPQEDSSWLDLLTAEEAFHIPEESTAQHLGVRTFTLRCGCDARKIAATLLAAHEGSIDLLFGADPSLEVECPRCGARLVLTREDCGGTSS